MQANIKVSGNIISELSEKIPSNIIALNELIKNSYDAGAEKVLLKLDTINKKLYLEDNGSGMNQDDINKLFHISNSNKKYGIRNNYGRLTQGSKGLGFLAAFKFGKKVKWITCNNNKGIEFSVDYDEIVKCDDISQYTVNLQSNSKDINGTMIEIETGENNENFKSLINYFGQEENYLKILYSFLDDNFSIEIQLDDVSLSNREKIELDKILPIRQIYRVKYSSETSSIEFYYKNRKVISKPYKINSDRYQLNLDLIVYSLKSHDKDKICKLFRNNYDELTPLIFVNDNLFNNYDMFNPNINVKKKYNEILPQMIGHINIISNDKDMGFNSDRTQFLQNSLTDEIRKSLSDLNSIIQIEGAAYRNKVLKQGFLKDNIKYDDIKGKKLIEAIKEDFELINEVDIEETEEEIVYKIFNTEEKIKKQEVQENNPKEKMYAYISLINKKMRIPIKSNQISLYNNIKEAKNSKGEDIKYQVEISINGSVLPNGVLESRDIPCEISIDYTYIDEKTNKTQENMLVEFYIPTSTMNTKKREKKIIELDFLRRDYMINYNKYVEKIHNEINSLTNNFDNYKELIACSLRSIFEISADEIENCTKFQNKFYDKDLKKEISNIITYVIGNQNYMSEISKSTKINYKDLIKKIRIEDFENAIDDAHMGAHQSTMYVKDIQIMNLAEKAGYFMIIANEMINNENIQ